MTVPVLLCVGVIDITIFSPMPSNLIVEIFTNVGFDELAVTSIWPKNT
jgi:2-keto-3-deoxy-L-rhamnonate aldolase RhmA